MFRVTRYPMISKTEPGRVGYRKKYRVAGRVRVPAGHCPPQVVLTKFEEKKLVQIKDSVQKIIKRPKPSQVLLVTGGWGIGLLNDLSSTEVTNGCVGRV